MRGLIEASRGEGTADPSQGKVVFNGLEVRLEDVGMGFLLSALAACTAKRIIKDLGLDKPVKVVVRGLVSLDDLIDEGEPPVKMLVVEVYVPKGVSIDAVKDSVNRCPGMRMIKHLLGEVIVRTGAP